MVNLFEPWNNSKLVKRDVVINEILQRANAFLLPTKRETREIELSVVFPLVDRWTLIHEKCIKLFYRPYIKNDMIYDSIVDAVI